MLLRCFFPFALPAILTLQAEDEWLHTSREPLLDRQGKPAFEGRHIRLASDTYPRAAASFSEAPSAAKRDGLTVIRFALDQPDDVLVRVVNAQGATLRTLACGVLGPAAPEPLQTGSLRQEILWDGLDARGQPAPADARIQVALGLAPKFEGFIDHDRGALLSRLVWLEVDPKGRVYAQVGTGRKSDRTMLRFDREGRHLDMPYPSNPETLKALGQTPYDVWPFNATFDGQTTPHRPRSWPNFAAYVSDWSIPYPMRIAADGTVYFAESTTGYPKWAAGDEKFRVFTTHMDQFWFLQMTPLMWSMGPFAIDGHGFGYLATSTADRATGTYPSVRETLNDPDAPGTIRKINLKTGQLQPDFTHNGREPRAEKSAYLGTTQTLEYTTVLSDKFTSRATPNPDDDSDRRFLNIVDLTVDRQGRILVADGWPRRVKCYAAHGEFLGELGALHLEGQSRRFLDLRGIAWEKDGYYLLAVLEGESDRTRLLKLAGDPARPAIRWSLPLDAAARHLAVDRAANPPHIWIGTGHGPASLTRVTDLGDEPGEVRPIGGTAGRHLRYPWNHTAAADGTLFVHDFDRKSLIRIDGSTGEWIETPVRGAPISLKVTPDQKRLFVSWSLGEQGNYSPQRVEEGAGFVCFDARTLERLDFRLESVYSQDQLKEKDNVFKVRPDTYYPWAKTYGGLLAGFDQDGHLYVRDAEKDQKWHKATPTDSNATPGVIRRYTPEGRIATEAHCRLFNTGGGVTMDSRGHFYAVELPRMPWASVVHDFQAAIGHQELEQTPLPTRGGRPVRTQSGLAHVVKMDAQGGARDSDAELWAHRGVSGTGAGGCYCDWPDNHLAIDGADRLFVADVDLHLVKVLDTAGNMITRIGRWGNAETVPGPNQNAADLGFRLIYCLSASGDHLYVSDKDLRRLAKLRMSYRDTRELALP